MVNFVFGDFVASLNNAKRQHLISIEVKNTKLVKDVINILYEHGLLRDVTYDVNSNKIEVFLKYVNRKCVFNKIKLVSVPSKRVYVNLLKLIKLKDKSNCSIFILSTNKGIKTDFMCNMERISGEILLKIDL